MKTQIIPLESYDDSSSISDRIKFSKAPRVLLLWPEKTEFPANRLMLEKIRRSARQQGKEVGLVCSRGNPVWRIARRVGIPGFLSIAEAQKGSWWTPLPTDWRRIPRNREELRLSAPVRSKKKELAVDRLFKGKALGGFGALVLLGFLLYFLPSATISIQAAETQFSMRIPFYTSTFQLAAQADGGIPSVEKMVTLTGNLEIPTSGHISAPISPAKGELILSNLTNQSLEIPEGTNFRSAGEETRSYRSIHAVILQPMDRSVPVSIEAANLGELGNVDAGAGWEIDGNWKDKITVSNPFPLTGGRNELLPAGTREDAEKGKAALLAELNQNAREQFQTGLKAGEMLIGVLPDETAPGEESLLPGIGQPGTVMVYQLKAGFRGIVVQKSQLDEIAGRFLDLKAGVDSQPSAQAIQYGQPEQLEEQKDGVIGWVQPASRGYLPRVQEDQIRQALAGRSLDETEKILQAKSPAIQAVETRMIPSFWPLMPFSPGRIAFSYIEEEPHANSGN